MTSPYSPLGEPRRAEASIADALALLEAQAPGSELVAAYARLAGWRYVSGFRNAETIAAAEQALRLAAELGLPEPALALGYRGGARAFLGDRQGLADMRRALALEQGRGRDAATLYNNLPVALWQYEGPQAALERFREGIEFCERRGIAEFLLWIASESVPLLAECGLAEQALAEAETVRERAEAAGYAKTLIHVRSVQLRLLAKRGEHEQNRAAAERLAASAREDGAPPYVVSGFAAAAELALAQGRPEQARALLLELEQLAVALDGHDSAYHLPELVRCTLALGDAQLATRLVAGVKPRTPLVEHALCTSRAALAEAEGEHTAAAVLFSQAARRWREFGSIPELAFALFGEGRCLLALGRPGAEKPLHEARDLFASMGYRPALAETEALLEQASAPTS